MIRIRIRIRLPAALAILLAAALVGPGCSTDEQPIGGGGDSGPPASFFPVGGSPPGGTADAGPVDAAPGLCNRDEECDDFDPCTQDTCVTATGVCAFKPVDCPENCFVNGDCDDGNPCTTDTCGPDKICTHAEIPGCQAKECKAVSHCNDGDPCTVDACIQGFCSYTASPQCAQKCSKNTDCDDDDACTVDECNFDDGTCKHEALNCSDGNACTVDECDSKSGCTHSAKSCDDNDACSDDGCDPASGCYHTPKAGDCEDGNRCTLGDRCDGGSCSGKLYGADVALRFEEGGGTTAMSSSGASHDALLLGGPTWAQGPGALGTALSLPGTAGSAVRVPGDGLASTAFSFGLWVRPAKGPGAPGSDPVLLSRMRNVGTGGLRVGAGGSFWLDGVQYDFAPRLLAETWTHVGVVYDGVTLRVFKDGVLSAEKIVVIKTIQWQGDIWLGQDAKDAQGAFTPGRAFGGRIDDFFWYERGLAKSEMLALAQGGSPVCADSNPCTLNACTPGSGCSSEAIPGCN